MPVRRLQLVSRQVLGSISDTLTSEVAKPEFIDVLQRIWILPVVLDYIDVVGNGQQPSEDRGTRIP